MKQKVQVVVQIFHLIKFPTTLELRSDNTPEGSGIFVPGNSRSLSL